jgi:hypothetical protein
MQMSSDHPLGFSESSGIKYLLLHALHRPQPTLNIDQYATITPNNNLQGDQLVKDLRGHLPSPASTKCLPRPQISRLYVPTQLSPLVIPGN